MNICELIKFFQDSHKLALLTFGVATLSVLMPIVLRILDYFRHRRRRRQQIDYIRKLMHDHLSTILEISPTLDSTSDYTISGNQARLHCFDKMIFDLKAVLHDYSSDLPHNIKKDIRDIMDYFSRSIMPALRSPYQRTGPDYDRLIFVELRKYDWLNVETVLPGDSPPKDQRRDD